MPNLSILHVAVFVSVGSAVLQKPVGWHTPGQSSRAGSHLSLWDAQCFPSSSSRSCSAQYR